MDELIKEVDEQSVSRRQAVTDMLESIAMEEKAISNILEAQAKKIRETVDACKPGIKDMIHIDEAVCECIKSVIKLQMLLQFRLEEVKAMMDDSDYC